MGIAVPDALGRERRMAATAEVTYGTFVKPATTSMMKALMSKFSYKQGRKTREDARQTRSPQQRITGKKECTWSSEHYIAPRAAGTAPDVGPMLKHALGVETVNASTSVVYTLTRTQGLQGSLSLAHEFSEVVMEALKGAWVQTVKISISGGNEPRISFEGGAADHVQTGYSTAASISNSNTVVVTAADQDLFEVDSIVAVGAQTDRKVTAKTANSLTVDGAAITATTPVVKPWIPADTYALDDSGNTGGDALAEIDGTLTLTDSGSIIAETTPKITAFELNITNNFKPINNEAFQDKVTDIIEGYRSITGSITIRARRDWIKLWASRKRFVTTDLFVRVGPASGRRMEIDLNQIEIEFGDLDIPQEEEGLFTLPFLALGTLAGEDECTISFK